MRFVSAAWVLLFSALFPVLAAAAPLDSAGVRLRIQPGPRLAAVTVDVELEPAAQRQAALAQLVNTSLWRTGVAMPRAGASGGDRADALRAARDALARYGSPPLPRSDLSPQASSARYSAYLYGRDAMLRIFAVAGEPNDSQQLLAYCRCATFGEKLSTIAPMAYLENRLGMLDHGTVERLTRANDAGWRAAAAMGLHAYGYADADANIVAFIEDPQHADDAYSAVQSLYDDADPRVLHAMRALFARTGGPVRDMAAVYLLAYGTDGDRRRVESIVLGPNAATFVAFLTADPARVASALARGNVFYITWTLPALRAVPPAAVPAQYNGIAVAANAYDAFDGLQTFAVPAKALAAEFLGGKFELDETSWVPWVNDSDDLPKQLATNFLTAQAQVEQLTQLDYLSDDSVRALLSAANAPNTFAPVDLFLAAHRVSTRAYYTDMDQFHDGIERRPYAVKASSTGYSGLVEMHPSLLPGHARFALHVIGRGAADCGLLAQMCADDAGNAYYQYMVNGGQAEVAGVTLSSDGRDVPAVFAGRTPTGWLLYDAPFAQSTLANAYLRVSLNYLGTAVPLTFDLFASDYARARTVLARRAAAHDARAYASNTAADWIAAARYYREMDDFDRAWPRYQRAIALARDAAPVWSEAANMYAGAGDHASAIAVLHAQTLAEPNNVDAWRALAAQLYYGARYAESASVAARALASDPADTNTELLQAMALYLSGDRRAAAQLLEGRSDNASAHVAPLWYLSEKSIGSERGADAENALAALRQQSAGPIAKALGFLLDDNQESAVTALTQAADLCRAHTYLGYHDLFAGDRAQAAEHFRAALATLQSDQLEYRMAQNELASLQGGPWWPWLVAIGALILVALVLAMRLRRRAA